MKKMVLFLIAALGFQLAHAEQFVQLSTHNAKPIVFIKAKNEVGEFIQKDEVSFYNRLARQKAVDEVLKSISNWQVTTCINKSGDEYDCVVNTKTNIQSPDGGWHGNDYDDQVDFVVDNTLSSLKIAAYTFLKQKNDSVYECRATSKPYTGYGVNTIDWSLDIYGLDQNGFWNKVTTTDFGYSVGNLHSETAVNAQQERKTIFDQKIIDCNQLIRGWEITSCISGALKGMYSKYNDGSYTCAKNKYTGQITEYETELFPTLDTYTKALEDGAGIISGYLNKSRS